MIKQDKLNRFNRAAVSLQEARRMILDQAKPAWQIEVSILESHGRRIAKDIYSNHPLPTFRRSGMDGFAVRSEDIQSATPQGPIHLKVIDSVPCGKVSSQIVLPGTAIRIMTGAFVPDGADTVIRFEQTEDFVVEGQAMVAIKKAVDIGSNITNIGEEVKEGELLIQQGAIIGPGEIALLATYGYSRVPVYAKPRVGIISTGSELVEVGEPLAPGKIRNSNSYMIASQVTQAGGEPVILGTVSDDVEQTRELIDSSLEHFDVLITTGGVSVGDYDVMVDYFHQMDGNLLFNKIALRPGSPTSVGVIKNKLLFGLSGNPGACFIGFDMFVKPCLWAMQGQEVNLEPAYQAVLATDYPKGYA
ncbi:MAG TPA: gephyrin-like molybdotransferase Glp, partial [Bacillota bacterium]|nr:gephyrin-like molybdotransferase Glp [Bacillota bacterium]